ncbi:hypothetical protein C8Q75DRAFT_833348 [Abortiporus biennis]|nr:hypothetical protein C8Q75DRAFT_833348 [Abortiporus biennis]
MTTSSDDEWIRIPSNGTTTSNWDTFPIGPGGPRSLSRAGSFRSVTPFSASSSPASRFSSLSRSRSRSKSFVSPKVLEHQKRPPREWRADFRMSPTLTSTLANIVPPGLTRGDSFNSKVHLHKYLRYMSPPQMSWEVREPPEHTIFYALPQTTLWDFSRLAADPPEQHMTLYSPYYPWHVEVNAAHLPGITFHELFAAIWISLNEVITTDDWYNTEMTESVRDKISLAYNIRCGTNETQRRSGVRRVDFLMERTVLEGFSKGTKGRWEMKLKKST